jgi:hypothetical protein
VPPARPRAAPAAATLALTVATAALSLLLALPLLWRRRAPFLAAGAVLLAIDLQALASGDSAEGLFYVVPIALAGYAIATYGTRRVVVWLALFMPAYLVYSAEDHNVRTWKASYRGAGADRARAPRRGPRTASA